MLVRTSFNLGDLGATIDAGITPGYKQSEILQNLLAISDIKDTVKAPTTLPSDANVSKVATGQTGEKGVIPISPASPVAQFFNIVDTINKVKAALTKPLPTETLANYQAPTKTGLPQGPGGYVAPSSADQAKINKLISSGLSPMSAESFFYETKGINPATKQAWVVDNRMLGTPTVYTSRESLALPLVPGTKIPINVGTPSQLVPAGYKFEQDWTTPSYGEWPFGSEVINLGPLTQEQISQLTKPGYTASNVQAGTGSSASGVSTSGTSTSGTSTATTDATTSVTNAISDLWNNISNWLQESSISSSFPNWVIAGAGVTGLFLMERSKHRDSGRVSRSRYSSK